MSQYKVPEPPTGNYGSSQNPFEYQMDQGVDPTLWFQEDATAYWDDYLCPEHPEAPQSPNGYAVDLDRKIASGQTGLDAYTSEGYMWLHKYYLYRKAKETPGILEADTSIYTFVVNLENQPLGQLYEVEKSIRELYQIPVPLQHHLDSIAALIHGRIVAISSIDSVLLDTTLNTTLRQDWIDTRINHLGAFDLLQSVYALAAQPIEQAFSSGLSALVSENNAISSTKTWELNQKFVNYVLLQRIIPEVAASTSELSQLHAIAASCPEVGGWSVYDARTYYAWLTDSIVPTPACMPIQERSEKQQQVVGVKIFPNPAINYLIVTTETSTDQIRLRLKDILGKTVIEQPLIQTIETVGLNGISPGIYFAQIIVKDKITATLKVVIAN